MNVVYLDVGPFKRIRGAAILRQFDPLSTGSTAVSISISTAPPGPRIGAPTVATDTKSHVVYGQYGLDLGEYGPGLVAAQKTLDMNKPLQPDSAAAIKCQFESLHALEEKPGTPATGNLQPVCCQCGKSVYVDLRCPPRAFCNKTCVIHSHCQPPVCCTTGGHADVKTCCRCHKPLQTGTEYPTGTMYAQHCTASHLVHDSCIAQAYVVSPACKRL